MLDKGFVDIVKRITNEKGKDFFLETRKFKSLFLDYAKNEFKRESTLLLDVLDAGCVKYINMAENLAECKQSLVKRLDEEYSLSPSKSAEMLDMLILILRGDKVKTPVAVELSSTLKNCEAEEAVQPPTTQIKVKSANTATFIKKPLFWVVINIVLVGTIGGLVFVFFLKDNIPLDGYIGGYGRLDAYTAIEDPDLVGAALPSTIRCTKVCWLNTPNARGFF